jgi:hypothetical protein
MLWFSANITKKTLIVLTKLLVYTYVHKLFADL